MSTAVQGAEELAAKFRHIAGDAGPKAIKAGIRASLGVIAKAIRSGVNSADISPELKRAVRKTIGQRLKKARGGAEKGRTEAKAGFSVGKPSKAKKAAASGRARAGKSGTASGVGVSSNNVHWFVLGTAQRTLQKGSERGPKSGHPTGAIQSALKGIPTKALAGAQSAALEAARTKVAEVIHREIDSKKK